MRGWLVSGMVAAVVLGVAAPAHAGSYRVWTCQLPSGAPAPTHDATAGWLTSLRPNTQFMTLADTCTSGGVMEAHLGGSPARGAGGNFVYVPPSGTTLGGFSVTWKGTVSGGGEATLSRSDQADPIYVERNGGTYGLHTVTQSGFDIANLAAIAACSFADPCGADPVDFTITRAVMTLNDNTAPQVTAASGDLLTAPTLRGVVGAAFSATDTGGGLYRVVVTSDGADVAAAPVPDPSGHCVQVDPGDTYAFAWPQPCPLSVGATVSVDASTLPEGIHTIGVYLEDAAGNRTALAAPATRTVIHRGAQNGNNGGDGAVFKRTGNYTLTTTFAHRRVLLRGTLTLGGAPTTGALLDVYAQNRTPGGQLRLIAQTMTDAQGRYSLRVPPGPSRLLRVGYRAFLGDQGPDAYVDVSERVHADVLLHAVTRHVSLRGTARFSGRLRGGFVPHRGKLIELQAFEAGRWRTFETLRTHRNGRFTAHYSFTRLASTQSLRFRARARYEPGYPFLLGVSHAVRVRVG